MRQSSTAMLLWPSGNVFNLTTKGCRFTSLALFVVFFSLSDFLCSGFIISRVRIGVLAR